jgi:hypothetical protein
MKKGQAEYFMLVILLFWAIAGIGWILNIVKLVKCDFKAPYKAEFIRVVGVVSPISIITGYMKIEDK